MHIVTLGVIALWLAGIVGWVMNIVTIINIAPLEMTGMLVARVIGVFVAPLGAVLGYI